MTASWRVTGLARPAPLPTPGPAPRHGPRPRGPALHSDLLQAAEAIATLGRKLSVPAYFARPRLTGPGAAAALPPLADAGAP